MSPHFGVLPTSQDSPFEAIAARSLVWRFFGVPFFRPRLNPVQLFDLWAYLLGPLAFFLYGMWRKGLILLCVGLFLYAPLMLPSDNTPLMRVFEEAYAPYPQLLEGMALLFVLLFCIGRSLTALLVFFLFTAVFLYGALHTESLYLGPNHGLSYVWLTMHPVWKAFFQASLAALLGLRTTAFAVFLFAGAGIKLLGFPLALPLDTLPAAAFPLFCGMMATYDRYRKEVRGETFWW